MAFGLVWAVAIGVRGCGRVGGAEARVWQLIASGVPLGAGYRGRGVSLLAGWLPVSVQIVAAVTLAGALSAWFRARLIRWLPILVLAGLAAVWTVRRHISVNGLADDPAPWGLWVWIGVAVVAVLLVPAGWRTMRGAGRALSVMAVPLALICVGLMLNIWVGYFPTANEAWSQLSAGPLPDEIASTDLPALAGRGATMSTGRLVGVDIPARDSHFADREQYVYLPPAWFAADHPRLPVLVMISGEFNTPADWIRVGDAVRTTDEYAAQHQGQAPVLVFADTGGQFNNDTECVNGPRGQVADYLTRDLPTYLEATFHTAPAGAGWGVVGWSAGGTCAVDLALMHPELFGTYEDIAGDLGPNTGDRASTIARLYGGSTAAWADFDPLTVLARHGRYIDTAGWFVNSSGSGRAGFQSHHRGQRSPRAGVRPVGGGGIWGRSGVAGYGGRPDGTDAPGVEMQAADQLCAAAHRDNVSCTLQTLSGRHSWQFAAQAYRDALPWLASRLGVSPVRGPASSTTASVGATTSLSGHAGP